MDNDFDTQSRIDYIELISCLSIILEALQWFLGDQLHNRWHLVSVQAPAHSQLFSIAQWTIIIPTGVNTPLFGSGRDTINSRSKCRTLWVT